MRIKVILDKKPLDVQKSDNKPISVPSPQSGLPAEDNSRLMLVLEDDGDRAPGSLKKEMEGLLLSISESRLKLEKLVDTLLEEYSDLQALDQRLEALAKVPSVRPAKGPRKGPGSASHPQSEHGELFADRVKGESLKHELECLQAIKHLLKSMTCLPDGVVGAAAGPASGEKKILIVEDDPVSRKLLSHFLEKEKYRVRNAASAEEGFQSISQERPDLILLDIMLPGVDGFQFLSRLKETESGPLPPVFVISSLTKESDIVKALQAGATDYILKPFSPQVILAKVRQILRSSR